jgi:hypothetical protein
MSMSRVLVPIIHATPSLHGGVVSDPVYRMMSFDVRKDSKSEKLRAPVIVAVPGTEISETGENTVPRKWFVVSASSIRIPMTAMDLSA